MGAPAANALHEGFTIDLATQQVFPVGDLPNHVPKRRGGKSLNKSTGFRWAKTGSKANDGTIVPLPTIRVAGTLCTSVEAFQWFCERLSRGAVRQSAISTEQTRSKSAKRAARELDHIGI